MPCGNYHNLYQLVWKSDFIIGSESESEVAQLCLTLCDPWTVAYQAPLSMRFSRQEYWSGLPFSSPGFFLIHGSNLGLLNCRQILYWLSYEGRTRDICKELGLGCSWAWKNQSPLYVAWSSHGKYLLTKYLHFSSWELPLKSQTTTCNILFLSLAKDG